MSEEIKQPGTELNEQELEGVSGGYVNWSEINQIAWHLCKECHASTYRHECAGGSRDKLRDYMIDCNIRVSGFNFCPFYKKVN